MFNTAPTASVLTSPFSFFYSVLACSNQKGRRRSRVEDPVQPRQGQGRPPPQGRRKKRLRRDAVPQARAQLEISRQGETKRDQGELSREDRAISALLHCLLVQGNPIKIRALGSEHVVKQLV